jgi:predicted extracellular nuclease
MSLVPYNGSNGTSYSTQALSGVIPDQQSGFGTLFFAISGLQNGAPDGIALVDAEGTVVQFLSYEGVLTATNGPANGLESTDIGVSEPGNTTVGFSMQLAGTGFQYADFNWEAAAASTYEQINTNQNFVPPPPFINEIHYDNAGTDANEGVEIAGLAGTDLFGMSLVPYNGSNGTSYSTQALSGVIPDQQSGFGTLFFAISGIQNGGPDGMALVDAADNVLQFLSYEGSFSATNGPAEGLTSVDIGVSEPSNTAVGFSMQLGGNGFSYADFSWQEAQANTFGNINTNQNSGSGGGDGGEDDIAIGECFVEETEGLMFISEIQGNGSASAFDGQVAIVEGVVTGVRSDGYFLQEETSDEDGITATSEGVFIFTNEDLPNVDDIVRVAGTVVEYFDLTEITSVTDQLICEGSASVTTVAITLPLTDAENLEHYEGMMVSVIDLIVFDTNDLWQRGELGLSHELKKQPTDVYAPLSPEYVQLISDNLLNIIYVEDNSGDSNPDLLSFYPNFSYANPIRLGDFVSATGPLNYSFSKYRINPIDGINIVSERETAPDLDEGDVKIATFNVLNYFNGESDGEGAVTFDYSANRGAENLEEFELQEARIVAAIVAMDADVIGLMEIENDGFAEDSAIQSLVAAVNLLQSEENQYGFVATADESLVGTDAIAVGVIYRASVVIPSGEAVKIDMPTQLESDNEGYVRMRVSLLQSFTHTDSGEDFAVVVNHFKSKGSGCYEDSIGTSDLDTIQGRCNAFRVSAAVTLGNALEADDLPERVMILGDLNAYSAEDPLAVLTDYTPEERGYTITTAVRTEMDEGASVDVTDTFGYINVAEEFDADGFSYWYGGFFGTRKVGSLDHVLVSPAFMDNIVDATHWNINSVEVYQLQYDQALSDFTVEDGYEFTEVGPYRSSDHDPFIVSINFDAAALAGDWDGDGDVDMSDIQGLFSAISLGESIDTAFDFNNDGLINIFDVYVLYSLCSRAGCAV